MKNMAGLSQEEDHYKSTSTVLNLSTSSEIGAQILGHSPGRAVRCLKIRTYAESRPL